MGMEAFRYHTTLTWAERKEVRDFFFGGLDQYRIAANSDHAQTLIPPKSTIRSDDVDFQRGEVEFGTTNVYFDARSYALVVEDTRPCASHARHIRFWRSRDLGLRGTGLDDRV